MKRKSAALNLSNEQLQVLLTGKFGDGCLTIPKSSNSNSYYQTNCKFKEYIDFKAKLLDDLVSKKGFIEKNGFSQTPIYNMATKCNSDITYIRNMNIEDALSLIDDLGIALWFYDDGSLHKTKLFYNLNTQAYSKEIQYDLFVPFFKNYNIIVKPTIERKKDGREFWYLRISKYEGAFEISNILNKYYINCYSYKIWSPETIQNWSKMQEYLKNTDNMNCSARMKSSILKKIEQGLL